MSAVAHIPDWMLEFARLEHHLENALEYSGGTHTVEDVYVGIREGQYQFWSGEDSAIVTEIIYSPQKTTVNYFLAGGTLAELETMSERVERWAREEVQADNITLVGRPGWTRSFLRDGGYETQWTVMSKELRDE